MDLGCDFKVRYPSEYTATRAARLASKRAQGVISSYRCEIHDCWHIGHPPLSRRLSK